MSKKNVQKKMSKKNVQKKMFEKFEQPFFKIKMSKFHFKKWLLILADNYCIYFITIVVSLNHNVLVKSNKLTKPKYLSKAQ